MQLIRKFNEGIRFFLCVIDIFSKCAFVITFKDEGITIANAVQNIIDQSNSKSNKRRVDKENGFFSRSMKPWLENDDLEMYSAYNEGESLSAKRSIRTLKNKIYKYMTSISKMCIFIR